MQTAGAARAEELWSLWEIDIKKTVILFRTQGRGSPSPIGGGAGF